MMILEVYVHLILLAPRLWECLCPLRTNTGHLKKSFNTKFTSIWAFMDQNSEVTFLTLLHNWGSSRPGSVKWRFKMAWDNLNVLYSALFERFWSYIEDIVFFGLRAELQLCAYSLYSSQNTVWPNLSQNTSNNEEYWIYILSVASQILDFTPASLHCALFFKWLKNVISHTWHYTGTSTTIFGLEP
jgi:hypothetical protein